MTIDLRAYVYCSLGSLVSGSLADDHLQEAGIVRTRGNAVINAIITPEAGSVVEFGYAKGTRLARLPRRLRVLSSFADPYSGQTTVQLGCLLTYLQDVQKPDEGALKSAADPYGLADVPAQYRSWAPAYISARGVFEACLTKLGLTSNGASLTNKFIQSQFKWDKPYVQIISDLLQSECQFGFMDCADVLQVRSLYATAVTGPLYDDSNIVEIESSGVGDLPGQSVYVPFSSLRLKPPDDNAGDRINWEYSKSVSQATVIITHALGYNVYDTLEKSEEWTNYKEIQVADPEDKRLGIAVPEIKEVKASVRKQVSTSGARALSNYASVVLGYGGAFISGTHVEDTSSFYYYDDQGSEYLSIEETMEDNAVLAGRSGIPLGFDDPNNPGQGVFVTLPSGQSVTRKTIRKTETSADYQKVRTENYVHFLDTQEGQQGVSAAARFIEDLTQAQAAINNLVRPFASPLVLQSVTEEVRRSGRDTSQERPSIDERMKAYYAKLDKNSIDNRTEEVGSIAIAYGSASSTRFVRLTMPYAPDDYVVIAGGVGSVTRSDAREKAIAYGRIQNRIRIGNRQGLTVRLEPGIVPPEPFAPCYVKAAGFTGQFRVNACSWSMGPNGLVCGMDLLFWAGVGEDAGGSAWFPIAPSVPSLPSTPAITTNATPVPALSTAIPGGFNLTDPNLTTLFGTTLPTSGAAVYPKTMAPAAAVPAFDETIDLLGRIRLPGEAYIVPPAVTFPPALAAVRLPGVTDHSPLLLLLHMDGTAGTATFTDSSEQHLAPTVVGSPVLSASGKFDQAYFNADEETDTKLEFTGTFDLSGDFTLEAWVNYSAKTGGNGPEQVFVYAYDSTGPQYNGIYIYLPEIAGTQDLRCIASDGSSSAVIYTDEETTPPPGTYFHVAFVRSGDDFALYVNGQQITYTTESISLPVCDTVYIGGEIDPIYVSKGLIDDVAIWAQARYHGPFVPQRIPDPIPTLPYVFGASGAYTITGTAATLSST